MITVEEFLAGIELTPTVELIRLYFRRAGWKVQSTSWGVPDEYRMWCGTCGAPVIGHELWSDPQVRFGPAGEAGYPVVEAAAILFPCLHGQNPEPGSPMFWIARSRWPGPVELTP